jgi:hypothetical protein
VSFPTKSTTANGTCIFPLVESLSSSFQYCQSAVYHLFRCISERMMSEEDEKVVGTIRQPTRRCSRFLWHQIKAEKRHRPYFSGLVTNWLMCGDSRLMFARNSEKGPDVCTVHPSSVATTTNKRKSPCCFACSLHQLVSKSVVSPCKSAVVPICVLSQRRELQQTSTDPPVGVRSWIADRATREWPGKVLPSYRLLTFSI